MSAPEDIESQTQLNDIDHQEEPLQDINPRGDPCCGDESSRQKSVIKFDDFWEPIEIALGMQSRTQTDLLQKSQNG